MTRPYLRALTTATALAAALGAAQCGDEDAKGTGSPAPGGAPARQGTGAAPRAPAAPLTPDERRAAVLRIVDDWHEAANDADTQRAVEALLATGPETAALLAEWMAGDDVDRASTAESLLVEFGEAALPPLVALLEADSAVRLRAAKLIVRLTPVWRGGAVGPDVCRALLAHLADADVAEEAASALRAGRPATAAIAGDLGSLWAHEGVETQAARILVELGPDAAPAARTALEVLPGEHEDRRAEAIRILSAIGSAAPEILGDLTELLDRPEPEFRVAAAQILRCWGDAAAPAAPRLAAFLRDPDENVRSAVAEALGAMPETAPSFAREMVAGCFADEDAWTVEADRALDRLVATPEFAARLVRMLPALPQREMVNCWNKLVHAGVDLTTALPEMAKSADPFVRGLSLDPWTGDDARGPPPAWAVALLDDPDDGVRATAAELVASKGGAPDARVRTVAMALRAAPEPSTRWSAVAALGALAARDPSVLAAVVEALSDESESVRTTAVIALARDDTPIPGPHPEAIARIADGLLDRGEAKVAGRALLRFEGGEELLVATVRDALRHPQEGPANDSPWQIVGAVAAAGPRAAPLRGALEAWRTDDPNAYADAALAEISRDPVELALHGDATTVARLLAMGPAGRRAVPLLVGRADENDLPAMLREVESAALADEIVAAAGTSDDAAHAGVVRMGAARMASGLPAPQAVDVLRSLAADPDADVRTAVVESLVEVERRAPGSVPPLLVAGLFHDEDEQVRHLAVNFVGCRGARARDAVPALREVLRSDHAWDRCLAALALWRVTGDPEEALRLIRPLLERPDQATVFTPWSEIGGALAAMPLGPADRDLLLRALPRAIEVHVRLAILEAIVPLGPAAAPAVPAFRAMLSDAFGAVGESDDAIALGETAARVLAGIGAAARPALPDLRAWIAASGDPHGVARQAVRTISAAR